MEQAYDLLQKATFAAAVDPVTGKIDMEALRTGMSISSGGCFLLWQAFEGGRVIVFTAGILLTLITVGAIQQVCRSAKRPPWKKRARY